MYKSKSFELDKADIRRILRHTAILYSPVILLFLDQIKEGKLDINILYALVLTTTIDIVRRFITNYTAGQN